MRSRSSLLVITSSFPCSSCSYFTTFSSYWETAFAHRSRSSYNFAQALTRASATAWASLACCRSSRVFW
jgi:hypothetical protein